MTQGLDHNGNEVPLVARPMTDPYDPSHTYQSLLQEYDNGKMDGFDLDPVNLDGRGWNSANAGRLRLRLLPAERIPDLLATCRRLRDLRPHVLVGDRALVPRAYDLDRRAIGRVIGDPENATNPDVNLVWGCDSPAGSTVDEVDSRSNAARVRRASTF